MAEKLRINWAEVARQAKPIINTFLSRGITPNLRTIYYALVSKEVIPNTKQSYKKLSEALVKARKQNIIPWDSIRDEIRKTTGSDTPNWGGPELYARGFTDMFWKRINEYRLPMWKDQPYYVEVWIEKQAMTETFAVTLRDLNTVIVPCRGYSSWSFLKESALRIEEAVAEGKLLKILYFGDFDPSGRDIERFAGEALDYFIGPGKFTEGINVDINRVCLTKGQIEQYKLPHAPEDAEEIAKMKRDPRFAKWPWGLYRVELDSLFAFSPDEFQRIVRESVLNLFDNDIHEIILNQQEVERKKATRYALKFIQELMEK